MLSALLYKMKCFFNRNDNLREDEAIDESYRKELMRIAPVSEEFYYVAPSGNLLLLEYFYMEILLVSMRKFTSKIVLN